LEPAFTSEGWLPKKHQMKPFGSGERIRGLRPFIIRHCSKLKPAKREALAKNKTSMD